MIPRFYHVVSLIPEILRASKVTIPVTENALQRLQRTRVGLRSLFALSKIQPYKLCEVEVFIFHKKKHQTYQKQTPPILSFQMFHKQNYQTSEWYTPAS